MHSLVRMPADSRVWCFTLAGTLFSQQQVVLEKSIADFLSNWTAHGKPVKGAFQIIYSKFLIIAADPHVTEISGCSIDSLFKNVDLAVEKSNAILSESSMIHYRSLDGNIVDVSRIEFKRLFCSGDITKQTIVFDTSIVCMKEFIEGRWELPAEDSWHHKLLNTKDDKTKG